MSVPDKKKNSPYIFWTGASDQKNAMDEAAGNIESYDGFCTQGSSRQYLDIEPNISVRPEYRKDDYYGFRPSEDTARGTKHVISMSMRAYDTVGIIKNIIDLMGDFGSQGISLYHPNKNVEKFYRSWWHKVQGPERSERFLNLLYRTGNVVIHKRNGKVVRKMQKEMTNASDIKLTPIKTKRREIPLKYDFLNPMVLEIDNTYTNFSTDKPQFKMKISSNIKKSYSDSKNNGVNLNLPSQIQKALDKGQDFIVFDKESVDAFYYKKDDWQAWAKPMTSAILDDIVMLEKMKLADMSALDGAISNVRLWTLGDLEHKILPNKAAIDKLRNILASNVGGGTMDLVWGPELKYQESSTQIYKFLGNEKYNPVLNSIYAGLGIPPTLTGLAGQGGGGGGFTNNFVSLKTLIERLEYGRELLKQFWVKEIKYVQKAMGFNFPAEMHFGSMILSDEATEKNLLIQLADRDVISIETLRERFGEMDNIENVRIKNENKKRDKNMMPLKSDPYHNGDIENEYKKIALQRGDISIEDVTDLQENPTMPAPEDVKERDSNKKPTPDAGRPKFSRDQGPRKQKRVLPKKSPNLASLAIWVSQTQESISKVINSSVLEACEKKTLRQLSKAQLEDLEKLKFNILCKIEPFTTITDELILASVADSSTIDEDLASFKEQNYDQFISHNKREPNIEEMRQIYNLSYSLVFFDKI
jgi:hypothetical protein